MSPCSWIVCFCAWIIVKCSLLESESIFSHKFYRIAISINLLMMSGLPCHFWTRNLLKETLFLLKKNSMKCAMNYNMHHTNHWDYGPASQNCPHPKQWNCLKLSFIQDDCRLCVAIRSWIEVLISANGFCSQFSKMKLTLVWTPHHTGARFVCMPKFLPSLISTRIILVHMWYVKFLLCCKSWCVVCNEWYRNNEVYTSGNI